MNSRHSICSTSFFSTCFTIQNPNLSIKRTNWNQVLGASSNIFLTLNQEFTLRGEIEPAVCHLSDRERKRYSYSNKNLLICTMKFHERTKVFVQYLNESVTDVLDAWLKLRGLLADREGHAPATPTRLREEHCRATSFLKKTLKSSFWLTNVKVFM